MSRFRKGWLRSTRRARFSFAAHPVAAAGTTPTNASVLQFAPSVLDQGQTGSCVGHATAGAIYTSLGAAGHRLEWVPSPKGIYTVSRCITRAMDGSASDPLTDDGAMPSDAMVGISKWGVHPMQAPTRDGRFSDCDPSTVNEEPRLDELEQDAAVALIGEHEIVSVGSDRVTAVRTALAAGFAVAVGIEVDDAFESYDGRTPVVAPDHRNLLGGHYVFLLGYETLASGATVFEGQNSWGANTGWGISGRFQAAESWLTDPYTSDINVMAVTTQEAP